MPVKKGLDAVMMNEVFILLGSNRGGREENLRLAAERIAGLAGPIKATSRVYESEPWGFSDPVPFLNQVVVIETALTPEALLEVLLTIEAGLGRIRPFDGCGCGVGDGPDYQPRTIDLDILFFGNRLIFTDRLMIPHPRLHERKFALVPLKEVSPGFIHPLLKASVSELLDRCPDHSVVKALEIQ